MTKTVVRRDDGRATLYYAFDDEAPVSEPSEQPKPQSDGQMSATDSDVVTEDAR